MKPPEEIKPLGSGEIKAWSCWLRLPDYTGPSGHIYKRRCRREAGHDGKCIPGIPGNVDKAR